MRKTIILLSVILILFIPVLSGTLYGFDGQFIVAPDPKFSSPAKTWQAYKRALQSGNIEEALSCLTPDFAERQVELLNALSNEQMKDMADYLGDIQVIKQDDNSAKYRNRQKELYGGREIELTYNIYFVNISGNWKIAQY